VWVAYINLVGGQDELVFDGQSFVMDRSGTVVASAAAFREDLLVADIPEKELLRKPRATSGVERITTVAARPGGTRPAVKKPLAVHPVTRLDVVEEVYEALQLGLADYVRKNGFRGTVIGLSGGIDSALVAALAADALGRDNIVCVFMPSKFTSRESSEDAFDLGKRLGVRVIEVPIDPVFSAYKASLGELFRGLGEDVTEENLQARIRGNILMALSNKFGWLVLTTGNKSEIAWAMRRYRRYGRGFAVIKDVPKTLVYRLCAWRNARGAVIPERIRRKSRRRSSRPIRKTATAFRLTTIWIRC
jgi:NAD+ synthase (glutamine-hydrolysing)